LIIESRVPAEGNPRPRRRASAGVKHVAVRAAWAALATFAVLVAAVGPGPNAQTATAPVLQPTLASNPDSALANALADIQGTPLSLADAVQAALKGSTTVLTAAAELRSARGVVRRERGAFDPELFADVNHVDQEQPSSSVFSGTQLRQTTASGGARVTLPFGTKLSASLDAIRTENNAPFTLLQPQYDAAGRLSLRQPLLRGFGPGTSGERSAVTREMEAADARYQDAVSSVQADVERLYWELYAAERDLAVARLIQKQASALVSQAQYRNRAGLVGPVQVATAQAFLAEQEQTVLDREEALAQSSDRLASQIGVRPSGPSARYHPIDEPPRDFPVDPEEELVDRALRNNVELRARERDVAAARARHLGARWNAYPSLDVFGTIGGTGLSGTPREVIFGGDTLRSAISGDLSDAISQARRREFATWSAGASLTIPIGFRAGAGERERLQAEADRAQAFLVAGQRALADDVRARHRELQNSTQRLDAARRGITASVEQVRIGVIEFNNGRTTAFELSRLAADLAAAQQRYSEAFVRSARAAAQLRYLTSGGAPPVSNKEEGTR